jgi:hypothetical protein
MPRRVVVAFGAVAAFVAGWLLPVAGGRAGWEAFRVGLSPVWPYASVRFGAWYDGALAVASGLTNIVFVLAVFDVLVTRRVRGSVVAVVLLACAAVDLQWLVRAGDQAGRLQIGYYVWLAAFLLLALAAPAPRR